MQSGKEKKEKRKQEQIKFRQECAEERQALENRLRDCQDRILLQQQEAERRRNLVDHLNNTAHTPGLRHATHVTRERALRTNNSGYILEQQQWIHEADETLAKNEATKFENTLKKTCCKELLGDICRLLVEAAEHPEWSHKNKQIKYRNLFKKHKKKAIRAAKKDGKIGVKDCDSCKRKRTRANIKSFSKVDAPSVLVWKNLFHSS